MKKIALIVAGGSGTRMNSDIPKQFIEIAGLPLLMHTILKFHKFDFAIEIVLVLPESQIGFWKQLCIKHNFEIQHQIVFGGATRFQSVKNGLNSISDDGLVFIHDAVRPFVTETTLMNCLICAEQTGNALPVISTNDSVRIDEGTRNYSANRSQIALVQTPQTFRITLIKNAYDAAETTDFTDDASVLENFGVNINLVDGNRENIKITTPFDLIIAEAILKQS